MMFINFHLENLAFHLEDLAFHLENLATKDQQKIWVGGEFNALWHIGWWRFVFLFSKDARFQAILAAWENTE